MPDTPTLSSVFSDIAGAIRDKTGKSDSLTPLEMPNEIESISGGVTPTGTINIDSNGIRDVTNYAEANVNVTSTISMNVEENGDNSMFIDSMSGTINCNKFSYHGTTPINYISLWTRSKIELYPDSEVAYELRSGQGSDLTIATQSVKIKYIGLQYGGNFHAHQIVSESLDFRQDNVLSFFENSVFDVELLSGEYILGDAVYHAVDSPIDWSKTCFQDATIKLFLVDMLSVANCNPATLHMRCGQNVTFTYQNHDYSIGTYDGCEWRRINITGGNTMRIEGATRDELINALSNYDIDATAENREWDEAASRYKYRYKDYYLSVYNFAFFECDDGYVYGYDFLPSPDTLFWGSGSSSSTN